MAAGTALAGYSWKIYQNSGTYASPTWALIEDTRDITIGLTADELDDSSRDSSYKKYLSGMLDLSVNFQLRYRFDSTVHSALLAKVTGATVFEIAVVDGPIATSGSEGWRMYVQLTSHNLNLPIGDNTLIDFTARPAYFAESSVEIDPSWYTVP